MVRETAMETARTNCKKGRQYSLGKRECIKRAKVGTATEMDRYSSFRKRSQFMLVKM